MKSWQFWCLLGTALTAPHSNGYVSSAFGLIVYIIAFSEYREEKASGRVNGGKNVPD